MTQLLTLTEIKWELQAIGCENVAVSESGVKFEIGSLKNIELKKMNNSYGFCIFENGFIKIAFGNHYKGYKGAIEHLKRVIANERSYNYEQ